MVQDHYEMLGVDPSASLEEIRAAWRERVKEYHPDLNQGSRAANEAMKSVNEAYFTLTNPQSRAEYDESRTRDEPKAQDEPKARDEPPTPQQREAPAHPPKVIVAMKLPASRMLFWAGLVGVSSFFMFRMAGVEIAAGAGCTMIAYLCLMYLRGTPSMPWGLIAGVGMVIATLYALVAALVTLTLAWLPAMGVGVGGALVVRAYRSGRRHGFLSRVDATQEWL